MIDDSLRYIIHSTDGRGEIVSITKKFLKGCMMKSEQFENIFFEFRIEMNHTKAYEKAEEVHEKIFGSRRYSSYESFRISTNRDSHRKTLLGS